MWIISLCEVKKLALLTLIVFSSLPGINSSNLVTLESIELLTTHEWLSRKPSVYFRCQGENSTMLPDVKKSHGVYLFKGAESWQPLTELADKKCKRCGLYEKDTIKADDIYDEWELCPDEFGPHGKYIHFKEKEFNATFSCLSCVAGPMQHHKTKDGSVNIGKVVIWTTILALICVSSAVGLVALYRYIRRKKREQEQARFLKLFEDGDDIDDELGLSHDV